MNWLDELDAYCEPLRAKAVYNTGSISRTSCMILRGMTEFYRPRVIVEVGTFIGKSTLSMKAGHIYTCDKDNDCLPSSGRITCFPKTKSTAMLTELVKRSIVADFFFFDGRIQREDIEMILSLSHPATVYAFDDFYFEKYSPQKGIVNVNRLSQFLPQYRLIEPLPGRDSTIAVLCPAIVPVYPGNYLESIPC